MQLLDRYNQVLNSIEQAISDSTRQNLKVNLIAVSKTYGSDSIIPLLDAGHKQFGENKVQEAEDKWPALKEQYPDTVLHLIGPLQSNKAKNAVALFDVIQTVDRLKIAKFIARECEQQDRKLGIFVQINTGEEPQKAGIPPIEADSFIKEVRDSMGLSIQGLMCIPPVDQQPSPHFALLAKIAERNGIECLSMGMSSDYETAIRLGATHIRVGSAIFGARDIQA
ncbi:MAG: YggS family pyridoxal phosphate-dependent enzyme [Alphaproteobacteria bacterium]|nr:YggS family pyridoxal phosphate-dependent enzyme [Alphaproteobacteria bacterium]